MPRVCTVCAHPKRDEIDKALIGGEASKRDIARQYRVSKDAIQRHSESHLPQALVKAQEAAEVANSARLLDRVKNLESHALGILEKAEQSDELKTALSAIREARECLSLLAKLLGELDERPVINLVAAPEWIELRTVILTALRPYPEARTAIAEAIEPHGTPSN